MAYGANAKADGSVITMITVELVTLPHTGTGGGIYYDQFKPIIMLNTAYSAVTVKADSPYNTLGEFLDAAKTKSMRVGNSGVGAIWHLPQQVSVKQRTFPSTTFRLMEPLPPLPVSSVDTSMRSRLATLK